MKLSSVLAKGPDSFTVFQHATEAICALYVDKLNGVRYWAFIVLLRTNEKQPDGIITRDLQKRFSDCIAYIFSHASRLPKDKKQFLIAEIEKYDIYTQLSYDKRTCT